VLEACATKPVTTALRTHALPALAHRPVFRDLVEGLLPDGGRRWFGVEHGGAVAMGVLFVSFLAVQFVKSRVWKLSPTMTKKDAKRLAGYETYVKEVKAVREELFKEYFKQIHDAA
jgi:hypothetical protein